MKVNKALLVIFVLAAITACKPEIDSFEPSAGNADFSKYIALGNSLTSGYRDGDLFLSGQKYSYPNIIAQQLKLVGGGEFTQPLMFDDKGFGRKMVLHLNPVLNCEGEPVPGATPSLGPIKDSVIDPSPIDSKNLTNVREYWSTSNLGVPGAKSFHLLLPFYGLANPYFARFSMDPDEVSILEQAMTLNHTFFTLWIGNNDILIYALKGGESDSITSVPMFSYAYSTIIETLTSTGAKGAVANIPDITSIAHFTTFPYNALILTDQAQVNALNEAYEALGITFTLGQNALIVEDENAPGGMRQIKSNELVLLSLPQQKIRCEGWGSSVPVPDKYFLDEKEIADIRSATEQYNAIIANIANSKGLAFVDANSMLNSAKSGLVFDGVRYSTTYITGGINSLDGIHLTPRGNALAANYFIQAINAKYQANIPLVNLNDYPGLPFP